MKIEEKTNESVVEGDDEIIPQPSPAATLTPYERLTNALQTDPRCAQEVNFYILFLLLFRKLIGLFCEPATICLFPIVNAFQTQCELEKKVFCSNFS